MQRLAAVALKLLECDPIRLPESRRACSHNTRPRSSPAAGANELATALYTYSEGVRVEVEFSNFQSAPGAPQLVSASVTNCKEGSEDAELESAIQACDPARGPFIKGRKERGKSIVGFRRPDATPSSGPSPVAASSKYRNGTRLV
ncbi:hypothetical protein EVAR_9490_1 [Eumeta japonica]|uniref:Uncharacterized protein n=1 Tax=Eumeta variegata TaxID=151549 RepID=A0A4C2A6D6_EUMVA|nr:hypothetical protein EVAR_9490_1 [Eumeta japonica]